MGCWCGSQESMMSNVQVFSKLVDITLVATVQYLHHGNGQMLQIGAFFFPPGSQLL